MERNMTTSGDSFSMNMEDELQIKAISSMLDDLTLRHLEDSASLPVSSQGFFSKKSTTVEDLIAKTPVVGRALDRDGLDERSESPGTLLRMASVWAKRLTAHGQSSIETLVPPLTFNAPPLSEQSFVEIVPGSGPSYGHAPNPVYTYAQRSEAGLSVQERQESGLPVYVGLTVQLVRMVGLPEAPAIKHFYKDASSKKSAAPIPFRIVRSGDSLKLKYSAPAARLAQLAKSPSPNATASILFTKKPMQMGEVFDDVTLFNQGGFILAIFGRSHLLWLVFVDFNRTAQSAQALAREVARNRQQQQQQLALANSLKQPVASQQQRVGDFPIFSEGKEDASLDESTSEKIARTDNVDDLQSRLASLSLESTEDRESARRRSHMNALNVSDASNDTNLESSMRRFLGRNESRLFLIDVKDVGATLVDSAIYSDIIRFVRNDNDASSRLGQLMISNLTRAIAPTVIDMLREGTWKDLISAPTLVRSFFKKSTNARSVVFTASVLMQTATLLRWSIIQTCEQDRQRRVRFGVSDRNYPYTLDNCDVARFNPQLFVRPLAEANREFVAESKKQSGYNIRDTAVWIKRMLRMWDRSVGLLLPDISINRKWFDVNDTRSLALLTRSKIMERLYSEFRQQCLNSSPTFELSVLKVLVLFLTACSTALLEKVGVAAPVIVTLVTESSNVATDFDLITLSEHFNGLLTPPAKDRVR